MLGKLINTLEFCILRLWWVSAACILCYMFYERGVQKIDLEYAKLYAQLLKLESEKALALETQEDLLIQLNSQSDPAWVELLLMKGLGVVPEGQTKIYFAPGTWNQSP